MMGIIQNRVTDDFDRLLKTKDIEIFIISMSKHYHWEWQSDIARQEIKEQLNKLKKEGYEWQLVKK